MKRILLCTSTLIVASLFAGCPPGSIPYILTYDIENNSNDDVTVQFAFTTTPGATHIVDVSANDSVTSSTSFSINGNLPYRLRARVFTRNNVFLGRVVFPDISGAEKVNIVIESDGSVQGGLTIPI